MNIKDFILLTYSIIFVSIGTLILAQDFFGERAGRCPQYPIAHHSDSSCEEIADCVRDDTCPASSKCCENPCGISKCTSSVLPVVPKLYEEKCPDHGNPEKILSEVMSGSCQPIQTKFCFKDSCRRCCVHISDCNPAEKLLMTAVECHKVLCKRYPCEQQGSYCEVDNETNEPRCLCNRNCNDMTKMVCGTDGVSYKNPCLLDLEACLLGIRIQVSHNGHCPSKPTHSTVTQNDMVPIVKPEKATIEPGETMAFVCKERVKGGSIKWYKRRNEREDIPVPVSLTYYKTVTTSQGERRRYLFLKIVKANRGNSGLYVCKQTYRNKVTEASVRLILTWIGKEKIGCNKPPDKGPCHGVFNNYFYNSKDGLCKPFVYGGCKGNENNFENIRDCTLLCKGLKARSGCPQSVESPDFCTSRQDRCTKDSDCSRDHNCCYVGCYKDCYKPIPITQAYLLRPEEEPCGQRTCKYYSKCQLTIDGNSKECSCPTVCSFEEVNPVCGSDQKTYPSECFLRVNACRWQQTVSVAYKGECRVSSTTLPTTIPNNLCLMIKCPPYATCLINPLDRLPTCVCPRLCNFFIHPICGSNGRTYLNECVMRVESCTRNLLITKEGNGRCKDGFDSVR